MQQHNFLYIGANVIYDRMFYIFCTLPIHILNIGLYGTEMITPSGTMSQGLGECLLPARHPQERVDFCNISVAAGPAVATGTQASRHNMSPIA